LLREQALPRWLRRTAAVARMPIPGPVDELVAVFVLGVVAVRYRPVLRAHWDAAGSAR
jgi:hypothetical protein